jgi:hypothetical protein
MNKKNPKSGKPQMGTKNSKTTSKLNINDPIFTEKEESNINTQQYNLLSQQQANEQLVKQKISEEYTADIFGKALSSAEHYSSRFGKRQIINMQFNYYNLFDSGINKGKEELKKSIIAFLDILQDYYQIDGKCFPSGIKINEVKKYLNILKENCTSIEDQNIFDAFISVINGKRIDFSGFFNTEKAFVNPNLLATKGINVLKSTGRQEKEWEKKVLENGNYDVSLNIGKNWTDNKNFSNLNFGNEENLK